MKICMEEMSYETQKDFLIISHNDEEISRIPLNKDKLNNLKKALKTIIIKRGSSMTAYGLRISNQDGIIHIYHDNEEIAYFEASMIELMKISLGGLKIL